MSPSSQRFFLSISCSGFLSRFFPLEAEGLQNRNLCRGRCWGVWGKITVHFLSRIYAILASDLLPSWYPPPRRAPCQLHQPIMKDDLSHLPKAHLPRPIFPAEDPAHTTHITHTCTHTHTPESEDQEMMRFTQSVQQQEAESQFE